MSSELHSQYYPERPGEIPHCSSCLCGLYYVHAEAIWDLILAEVEKVKIGEHDLFWGRISGMVTILSEITHEHCKDIYDRIYQHLNDL